MNQVTMNQVIMKQVTRFLVAMFLLAALGACGQPASEQAAEADPAPEAPAADDEKLVSIDGDGNIAPFGFAAKEPVAVAEPEAAVATDEAALASAGADIYGIHCVACHGADAKGVQGLGLNLVDSEFVASASDAELTAFLQAGRAADAPDNITGVPMPGFAWMSEAELADITSYLQGL